MIYTNKIENHKLGDTTPFADVAKSLGWTLAFEGNEVERSEVDACWYEKGFAPKYTDAEKAEQLKTQKLFEAQQLLTAKLAEISNYPQAESASFDTQEKEAAAYLADNGIAREEIPTITGIAAGAQVELAVLAQKIVDNAKDFAPLRGLYLGRHKRVRDLLNKATTLAEVEAVDVAAIFEEEIGDTAKTMLE